MAAPVMAFWLMPGFMSMSHLHLKMSPLKREHCPLTFFKSFPGFNDEKSPETESGLRSSACMLTLISTGTSLLEYVDITTPFLDILKVSTKIFGGDMSIKKFTGCSGETCPNLSVAVIIRELLPSFSFFGSMEILDFMLQSVV